MSETLFNRALAAVGNNKAELARRCDVSTTAIQKWKKLDDDHLSVFARLELKRIIEEAGG
jgi:hypothetical protein